MNTISNYDSPFKWAESYLEHAENIFKSKRVEEIYNIDCDLFSYYLTYSQRIGDAQSNNPTEVEPFVYLALIYHYSEINWSV